MFLTDTREGVKDIEALREAYKNKIESLKREAAGKAPKSILKPQSYAATAQNIPFQPPPPPPLEPRSPSIIDETRSNAPPGVKTLSTFLDIKKTLELPNKEIEYIWRLRHANNPNSLCAIIPGTAYAHIALMARKHPQFVLPLPREEQGAEIHFLQWTFPHINTANVLFTTLAEYKLRGEYASPHTTVSMHTELLEPKGIVLAQGNVMSDRGVGVDDGKWLFMCLQKFYGLQPEPQGGQRRKLLMDQFTKGDEQFQIQSLLDEAERLA
jgi:ATP synthase mitochondrial F1 complex assembly factor 1